MTSVGSSSNAVASRSGGSAPSPGAAGAPSSQGGRVTPVGVCSFSSAPHSSGIAETGCQRCSPATHTWLLGDSRPARRALLTTSVVTGPSGASSPLRTSQRVTSRPHPARRSRTKVAKGQKLYGSGLPSHCGAATSLARPAAVAAQTSSPGAAGASTQRPRKPRAGETAKGNGMRRSWPRSGLGCRHVGDGAGAGPDARHAQAPPPGPPRTRVSSPKPLALELLKTLRRSAANRR